MSTASHLTTNPAEAASRTRKAHRIAAVLAEHHATADQALALDAKGRSQAALLAGVRPASDATWACVVTLLRLGELGA